MTTPATFTVRTAIEDSIRENRIVELTAALDTAEWVDLADALSAECDDYAEHGPSLGYMRDYWGEDEDGDAWRIRLVTE